MIAERIAKRLAEEIKERSALIEAACGGSVQFTVQLDAAGMVKQISTSIQVKSNGVIPK